MDTVTCAVCRGESPPGDYCGLCRSKLVAAAPEAPEVGTEAGEVAAAPVPAGAPRRCATPGCGQSLAAGDVICRYCGEPVSGVAPDAASTLAFPWGSHALREGETVELGRAQQPFAKSLADYPNVGRTHARVARPGALIVTDLGSTNGTFVDGSRLPPNSPTELRVGQVLRLAASLEIEIR